MSGNSQEKQPAVRPGLVVVLLVALGGTLYWRFFMQPNPGPVSPVSPPAPAAPLINNNNNENQPAAAPDLKVNIGPTSKRDLFLPPPSVIAARRKKDNMSPSQPIRNEPQLIKPDQGFTVPAKEDENSEKPILKGIMGTASSQVIIVRYQNKSYLLKLGEILPGTQYRVAEINHNSVILQTPKGSLKLEKKERAK